MFKSTLAAAVVASLFAPAFAAPTYFLKIPVPGLVAVTGAPSLPGVPSVPPVNPAPTAPPVPAIPAPAAAWALVGTPETVFGEVALGSSAQRVINLTNSGTAEGTFVLPTFTGVDKAEFSLSGSTCAAVQPKAACQLTAVFAPVSAGPKAAALSLAGAQLQYSGAGLAPADPATAMLLHMNGPAGSTTFVDENGNGVSARGGASISTASPKFGTGAASFNGTNQSLVFSNELFNFGSADYTVEAWVRPATGNNSFQTLISNSWGWQLYWTAGSLSFYVSGSPTGPAYYGGMPMNTAAGSVPAGAWTHIAVVRKGNTLTLFTGGKASASVPFSAAQVAPRYPASLGAVYTDNTNHSYFFAGQMDEFRVTKNVARYSANFTPAVQEFAR